MTCRIGLPLPFYNMKCTGNQLLDLFSTYMESPFGWVTFFPIPSLLSSTFAFWDIRRNLPTQLRLFLFLHLFLIKWPFCFLLRSFTEGGIYDFWNNKQQAKSRKYFQGHGQGHEARSRKYFTRGTGYVSRDPCITCCAGNVRINNSRHRRHRRHHP